MAINRYEKTKIVYNNVDLGDVIELNIEANPIYDETGLNNVKYLEHTITVESIIHGHGPGVDWDETYKTGSGQPGTVGSVEHPTPMTQSRPTYPMWTAERGGGPAYGSDGIKSNTDPTMSLYRLKLMEARKPFYLINSGYGQIVVKPVKKRTEQSVAQHGDLNGYDLDADDLNFDLDRFQFQPTTGGGDEDLWQVFGRPGRPGGGHNDLNFGPKPNVLKFEPIGGRQAARVVWEIKVYTKDCLWNNLTDQNLHKILSFNFSQEFSLDRNYCTTRTIQGKIIVGNNTEVIPLYDKFKTSGSDTSTTSKIFCGLDFFKNSNIFSFDPPAYFKRTKQQFTENENNTEFKFNLVDVEIDSQEAYPQGVVDIDVTHDTESELPFSKWNNSIQGTITLKPGLSYFNAWTIFALIVYNRIRRGAKSVNSTQRWQNTAINAAANAAGKFGFKWAVLALAKVSGASGVSIIPLKVTLKERLYRDKSRYEFSYSWSWMNSEGNAASIADVSKYTGMFTSPQQDWYGDTGQTYRWPEWKDSLHEEGNSNLNFEYSGHGQASLQSKDGHTKIVIEPCEANTAKQLGMQNNFGPDSPKSVDDTSFYKHKLPPLVVGPGAKQNQPPAVDNQDPQGSTPASGGNQGYGNSVPDIFFGDPNQHTVLHSMNKVTSLVNYDSDYVYSSTDEFYDEEQGTGYDKEGEREPNYFASGSEANLEAGAGHNTYIVRRTTPRIQVILTGEAFRKNGPLAAPRLEKIGGVYCHLKTEIYDTEEVVTGIEGSIHKSSWEQTYELTDIPYHGLTDLTGYGILYNSRGLLG
jgi:hypothetical protein